MDGTATALSQRADPLKVGRNSIPGLEVGPEGLQILFQTAAEQDGAALRGNGIGVVQFGGDLHVFEEFTIVEGIGAAEDDDNFAGVVARPPIKIVLMPADGLRPTVVCSKEID